MKSWENLTSLACTFPILPVCCNHFTLGNPKSHFSAVLLIETSDYYIISQETNYLLYCSLSVYLLLFTLPIICVALFYGQFFLSLWSVIFKATNANPQPALFRVTNIWRNATLSVHPLTPSRKNYRWDLRKRFAGHVSVDKKELIKFGKSAASRSRDFSEWFFNIVRSGIFSQFGSYLRKNWLDLCANFIARVLVDKEVYVKS